MKRYDPQQIEPKWQAVWATADLWAAPDKPKQNKAYIIPMFPYPSADGLHVGHARPYTAADIWSHFERYHGKAVLHATGWDAFGLPAENAAIKKKVHPTKNTAANIENYRRQLKSLGISYDWNREVNTSDPAYYKWTQWIFAQLFKAGLAYRASGWQWWCPKDKTVLANEQVVDGKCERCDSEVTKKELTQWYFKVTEYADELIDSLDDLDWPESIKTMQRNWIGRSEGAEVRFATDAGDLTVYTTRPDTLFGATYMVLAPEHELVEKLTTKAQATAVTEYVAQAKRESEISRTATDKEKTGVFTGSYAVNPVNQEKIPIWIADYVLASYGTGAIMAVPAHDQRDYEFAQKFDLPITPVIEPTAGEPQGDEVEKDAVIVALRNPKDGKILALDWGPPQDRWGGTLLIGGGVERGENPVKAAVREIAEETGYVDVKLVKQSTAKGHGYFFSNVKNQNYLAHCTGLLFELVSEKKGTTKLDKGEQGKFTPAWIDPRKVSSLINDSIHATFYRQLVFDECYSGEGVMINSGKYDGLPSDQAREKIVAELEKKKVAKAQTGYKLRDWLISRQRYWGTPIPIVHCEKCGPQAVPEKDLPVELPEIEDYLPTGDGRSPLAKVKSFVETKCPKCGGPAERETDTMDTFADSSWYFLRYPNPRESKAAWSQANVKAWLPVDTYVGGADHAVLHLIYARFWTMALADLKLIDFREPFRSLRHHGMIQAADGRKMSKSLGNVVSPDEIIEALGADTLRVYEMFIGPYDQAADWSDRTIEGTHRFLKRVWAFGQELAKEPPQASGTSSTSAAIDQAALNRATARAVKNVTRSIERFRFNTAVSALMEALNEFTELKEADGFALPAEWKTHFERFLVLLSPFAPHLAEELWHELGNSESIFKQSWPEVDESALATDTATVVVQVNGKVRTSLQLPVGVSEAEAQKAALAEANVKKFTDGKPVKKTIYVPDKILNLVV